MTFAELMTDVVAVYDKKGELVAENIKASVQGGSKVFTLGAEFPVEIGYFVERKMRTGIVDRYKVLEPNYYGNFHGIPAHYQMKVVNVNAIPDPRITSSSNTINASGNARVYQNSVDNSMNSYSHSDLQEALSKVKSDIIDLDLEGIDQALTAKAIGKITEEIDTGNPNKDRLGAYISLLPTSIATLESVLNLANMVGLG